MMHMLRITFKGIFAKFALMFILVGLIPIMAMSYMIFEKLPEEVEAYMVASYGESLLYAAKNIELKVQAYDQLTQNVYQYDDVENARLVDVLKGEDYENLTSKADTYLEDYLRYMIYADNHIETAFLVGPDQEVFDYYSKSSSYYYEHLEVKNLPGFLGIYDDGRSMTILPTHQETYFTSTEKEVVTFARNCLDLNYLPAREIIVATLLLEVDATFIDEIISRMEMTDKGSIYIVDKSGHGIYASNGDLSLIDTIDDVLEVEALNKPRGHQAGEDHYLFYQDIEGSDWRMIFTVDKSSLLNLIDGFSTATTVILIAIMLALLFVAVTFSNNLSKPIRSIIGQMKQVSAGNLETKVRVKASYEVNQLADAFNHMTDQLKLHIDQAYGAQIKQREAELNSLKTQIRPHYLYNTLEIIRMSALEESADNTREMIVSLSEQLKYVIGQYGDRVTLGNEIDMIENYFRIINKRYEGRITLDLDIPQAFYNYEMLKLLVQPLVENAVVHGLKVKKGRGRVRVTVRKQGQVLTIDVLDDGVGMTKEKLNEIQALLVSEKMGKELNGNWENIGLKNVHDRIQMNYGQTYGLIISSKENLGTKMSISFPVDKE